MSPSLQPMTVSESSLSKMDLVNSTGDPGPFSSNLVGGRRSSRRRRRLNKKSSSPTFLSKLLSRFSNKTTAKHRKTHRNKKHYNKKHYNKKHHATHHKKRIIRGGHVYNWGAAMSSSPSLTNFGVPTSCLNA